MGYLIFKCYRIMSEESVYILEYRISRINQSDWINGIDRINQIDRIKGRSQQKKTGFFGNFSQVSDPPSPPFGNPCFQKKVWFILHFRSFGAFLVFTKMFTFW